MCRIRFAGAVLATIVAVAPAFATSRVPDPRLSRAYVANDDGTPAILLVVPSGEGPSFREAMRNGSPSDATITLELLDPAGTPIAYFPAVDLWLEAAGPGTFTPCGNYGTIPDADTDVKGMTHWQDPLQAMGWSEGPTIVMIIGMPLETGDPKVGYVSPDINGDGVVNIADIPPLAQAVFGDYAFPCDFNQDGAVNLTDIQIMARFFDVVCPY